MNLVKKLTATAAIVGLTSTLFTTGVSAAGSMEVEAANKLANAGIVVDHSDNTAMYELNRNVLRQEIAAVARGIAKVEKASTYEAMFTDVTETTPNNWAWKTVNALRKADLIAANTTFRPEANITKSEGIGMVVKACYGDAYAFDSSKEGNWQKQVVDFAVSKGMTEKFTDYNALATRGFVFKAGANCLEEDPAEEIICKLLGTCGDKDDKDNKDDKEDKDNNVVIGDNVLMVELSPETPKDGNVAAGAARTKMLAFDVTAGNTDVTLKNLDLKFTGLGDSKYISDLAVYDGLQKVTKGGKKFQSDDTADLSFERDVVIEAGETKTLFVTATIAKEASNYNQTLQLTLTNLEATSTVKGDDDLVGSTLTPILVKNVGSLELKSVNKITKTINIGEVSTLTEFTLDETSDKEDVAVKSITMELDGSFDSDDLTDLALYADGTKVEASFEVKSSELEIELDQVVTQDKKVKFQLKGAVAGSVNDDIQISFEADAIYAVGKQSGVSISIDTTNSGSNKELAEIDIEGSEINIAFNRNSKDEAKPGADDVELATIDVSSSSDYTISDLTITIENTSSNGKTIEDIVKTLELDNSTYDSVSGENTDTAVYTFEDIDLSAGESKKLPLVMDIVNETAINGSDLEITLDVVKVKDEDNNKTYTSSTSPKLSTILSNNSFTAKTLEVKSASLEVASTEVNNTEVVLGNGIKTVIYKGKLSIGDADTIVLSDLTFDKSSDYTASVDVDEVISDATLNIGGKTFKGDVETNKIEFNNINATIAAGADNVEMLVVATLKDNDTIANNSRIGFKLDTASIDADDSEGDEVLAAQIDTANANTNLTYTILNDRGTFYVATTDNGDNEDDIEEVVLAGTNSVKIGEVQLQADMEDADVERLTFVVTGEAQTGAVSAPAAMTLTSATPTPGSTTTVTSNEKTKFTVTTAPTVSGNLSVVVNGATYTVAVLDSDSATTVATKIATAIGATATATSDVVIVTDTGTTNQTDATVSVGSTNAAVQVDVLAQGGSVTGPTSEVQTLTANRAFVSGQPADASGNTGDIIAYNGTNYTNLSALANAIVANEATVSSASVDGLVITLTGDAAGNSISMGTATPTSYLGVAGGTTTSVDFSSTFKNVKLMDGSTTVADNATLSYVGTKTYITFKDFNVKATDNIVDMVLVADFAKYTTSGSETSAELGKFTILPYTGTDEDYLDVKGKSSQEDYTSGTELTVNTSLPTEEVSIVPVTVTVSIDNKMGTDDKYAKIKFTINEGNNNINDDDVAVSSITLSDASSQLTVRNDANETIGATQNVAANADVTLTGDLTISNGDMYEFKVEPATGTSSEVRIEANGIKYTVDGNTYEITNDSVIDLGSYTND